METTPCDFHPQGCTRGETKGREGSWKVGSWHKQGAWHTQHAPLWIHTYGHDATRQVVLATLSVKVLRMDRAPTICAWAHNPLLELSGAFAKLVITSACSIQQDTAVEKAGSETGMGMGVTSPTWLGDGSQGCAPDSTPLHTQSTTAPQ